MSWRDQYQPGSFRGALFRTEGHERSGGRRAVLFEFPGRDDPLSEDMGRRQRQFSLECHVAGPDYIAARDALIEALEAEGPGLLVHPWHGQIMAVVLEYTSSENTGDGGVCWFRLTLAEAGAPVQAPASAPAGTEALAEAARQKAAAPERFARMFSIDKAAGFVEAAAGTLISGMAEVSQLAAGLQGGTGPALRAFEAGLRFLPDNLASLLRSPVHLAQAVQGLVGAVALLGPSHRSRSAALARLVDWQAAVPAFPVATPSRRREADNRTALLWLFHAAAAGELAAVAASAPYASYEEAVAAREAVATRLDALALDAADRGDDEGGEGYDRLRRALVRDLTARGQSLARVHALILPQTLPALAVANRQYGSAGVEARAGGIVARNRIAHPGFVPGGRDLQVLSIDAPEATP